MEPTDKIIFICPACAFRARIPGQYIGQTIRCPGCNTPQKVTPPAPDYEASGRTVAISRVAVSDKPAKPAPSPVAPISEAIRVPGKGPAPTTAAPSITDSASEGKLLFVCASCKLRARVPARFGGQTIRCPKCQTPGVVPRTNANPAIEQSTGSTVMITRAQLEAPAKPSGSGRWRDPSKPRAPTPLSTPTPPAPAPEPTPPADDPDSDLLGPPLESSSDPLGEPEAPAEPAAESPSEPAAETPPAEAPPAEAEEDPLADTPQPELRPRQGVVHRRGNSSAAIDVPKSGKSPTKSAKPVPGKPIPGKPGKPAKAAPAESTDGDDAPAPAKKKGNALTLILAVLLVIAIAAAAWGWSTAFAAQAEVAVEKARSAKTLKAMSEAQFAFTEADNRAKALAAKLASSASAAATADPAPGDAPSDSATTGATAPDGK